LPLNPNEALTSPQITILSELCFLFRFDGGGGRTFAGQMRQKSFFLGLAISTCLPANSTCLILPTGVHLGSFSHHTNLYARKSMQYVPYYYAKLLKS
jgi:hypothetical protein